MDLQPKSLTFFYSKMKQLYNAWVLFDDTTMQPFLPFHAVSEEWLKEYMKKNPFPETEKYDSENLFNDFMGTDIGTLLFFHLTEKQKEWIEDCCNSI